MTTLPAGGPRRSTRRARPVPVPLGTVAGDDVLWLVVLAWLILVAVCLPRPERPERAVPVVSYESALRAVHAGADVGGVLEGALQARACLTVSAASRVEAAFPVEARLVALEAGRLARVPVCRG